MAVAGASKKCRIFALSFGPAVAIVRRYGVRAFLFVEE
jgi:hypothetical protein